MTAEALRTLALDLGDVRIGLALSDPLGITAQPAGVLERKRSRRDLESIAALVRDREVGRVVVGHPLLLSGVAGSRARDAEQFARELRALIPDVPVELWDERLTTKEAERVLIRGDATRKRRREVIDALAAVLILDGYMGSRRAREGDGS